MSAAALAGTRWQIGWAEGTHQPVWAEGADDSDPVADVAQGASGTLVAFTSTSELAGVRFDPGAFPIYPAADPTLSLVPAEDLLADGAASEASSSVGISS